jgi:hypothetical protein
MFFHVYGPPEHLRYSLWSVFHPLVRPSSVNFSCHENATWRHVSVSRIPCRRLVLAYRRVSRSAVQFYIDPVLNGNNENCQMRSIHM